MIPNGWQQCVLPDFTHIVMGQSPPSTTYNRSGDGLPFFQGKAEFGDLYPTVNMYCSQPNKIAKHGATLLSVRAPVGPTNLAQHECCIGRGLVALHPCGGIEPKFLLYLFRSIGPVIAGKGTGSTFKAITKEFVEGLEFNLPSLSEQHRIVAKIEELFSELDKGVESLKTARAKLNVYRQAVLKHAFEGKLTAQWREENKDKLEKPEQLLARIKQERAERYEAQLENWKTAVKDWESKGRPGKKSIKPRRPGNTLPLTAEELRKLPDLPAAWHWVNLGQLVWSVKDGPHYSPKYSNSGIPFITGGNIQPNGIDFSSAKFITPELHKELSQRCKPERGDVLYTKGGTTGIACVNTYDFDFNVWVHVAVLKTTISLEPFYLQHALNSPGCYAQSQEYTHGVGNQDLGLTRMVNIVLPLCCIAEQKQIIQIAERVTYEIDRIEDDIEKALTEANALRQSILRRAFSGQLVAQDPRDEPASVLLDRIRAEREKNVKNETPKKKNKRKTAA